MQRTNRLALDQGSDPGISALKPQEEEGTLLCCSPYSKFYVHRRPLCQRDAITDIHLPGGRRGAPSERRRSEPHTFKGEYAYRPTRECDTEASANNNYLQPLWNRISSELDNKWQWYFPCIFDIGGIAFLFATAARFTRLGQRGRPYSDFRRTFQAVYHT